MSRHLPILLRITFLCLCCIFPPALRTYAITINEEIAALYNTAQQLNKEAISNISYELQREQSHLGGSKQKIILKGSDGNLWLFKFSDNAIIDRVVIVSSLAKLFGVNCNEVYPVRLPINGEAVGGYVQILLPHARTLSNIPPQELTSGQIEELQKQQVLDWLIYNFDAKDSNFLLLPKSGKLIGIDKDLSFKHINEAAPLSRKSAVFYKNPPYYDKLWASYAEGKINADFFKTFELIDHIQNFDDNLFTEIFEPMAQENDNGGEISPAEGYSMVMEAFRQRKKNLRDDFRKFYRELNSEKGQAFQPPREGISSDFSKDVLQRLKNDISEKAFWLEKINSHKNSRQNNLEVVCSDKAWNMLLFKVVISEEQTDFNRVVAELKSIRSKAASIHEKLAVSLYIAKIRRMNEGDKKSAIRFIAEHPEDIMPLELLSYLSTQEKILRNSREQTLDEEDYYLLGLAYLVKKQYKDAKFYFDKVGEPAAEIPR
ncbi:MAG: hypothetical protein WC321_01360 [Candidatus Omnitrophota bacterium]|jgi:hypothetical protein